MERRSNILNRNVTLFLTLVFGMWPLFFTPSGMSLHAASAESHFKRIKNDPLLLRDFLYRFPKGGELHSHLDGAVYAESYIAWAAADGKCIVLSSYTITVPPCDASAGRPRLAELQFDTDRVNRIIDAFSVRNYELRPVSGHDQFFATFQRFSAASKGRDGSMLAEVTARAARQNTGYLELMDSAGMRRARTLAAESGQFDGETPLTVLAAMEDMDVIVSDIVASTDRNEQQWREQLGCNERPETAGCAVEVRYLAQVIRTVPIDQVLAQTLFAFKLIAHDPRYVGLNFVAPEDAPITLRDYTAQMEVIRDVSALFPDSRGKITLHAGELALPLVSPDELQSHILEAVHIAGASRIGHGVDIIHEREPMKLLSFMAEHRILVEINLSSNAVILGIEGEEHPFDLYRSAGVPLALSTDDEGVARIDLTHEYQRATQTYDLSYDYLKELSRNVLAYSFLPGDSLFRDIPKAKKVKACRRDRVGRSLSQTCEALLNDSEKARMQWQLESRFEQFEAQFD